MSVPELPTLSSEKLHKADALDSVVGTNSGDSVWVALAFLRANHTFRRFNLTMARAGS